MGSKTYWEFLWGTEAVFVTPEYKNFEEATKASAEAEEAK